MVSVPETLFIGLVTYPGTRFPDASGPTGLMETLAQALRAEGVEVTTAIAGDDAYDPAALPITSTVIEQSIDAELNVETSWHRFLNDGRMGMRRGIQFPLRRRSRRKRYLAQAGSTAIEADAGYRMVRRLINIELSHMQLLRAAVASGASWSLIIEDDAAANDLSALAGILRDLMSGENAERTSQAAGQASNIKDNQRLKYLNISESFTAQALGIEHLLQPVPSWNEAHPNFPAFESRLPVTNTVCAIAYDRDFLMTLLESMESIPTEPVIPIDWKLNQALMNLTSEGEIKPGDCWSMFPAPIVQRSMVDAP